MATDIKNVEELSFDDVGIVRSSYKVIQRMSDILRKNILPENSEFTGNPANALNLFLEEFGRREAQMFFEQQMLKNETLPSTAILLKSLLNKMNDNMLTDIFAYPSSIPIVIGFRKDLIIKHAIPQQNMNNIRKLVLNKDTKFYIDGQQTFILDHNVEIVITNYGKLNQNIYAKYDLSDKYNVNTNLTIVNNPIIPTQYLNYNNKNELFLLLLNVRQYERDIIEYEVINDNPDIQFSYTDKLYGFELLFKKRGSNSYNYIVGSPLGNISPNGYNYEIDFDTQIIKLIFNKFPDYFKPEVGDTLKFTVYTTKGKEGNFSIPNLSETFEENDSIINISFQQDRNIIEQEKLLLLQPYLSIRNGNALNGKDMKSFEDIRKTVILRGSNIQILTPGELERKAIEEGLIPKKLRDDPRCLEYQMSGSLFDNNDEYISAKNINLKFNFDDIPIIPSINARMITPKSVFEQSSVSNNDYFNYMTNPNSYIDYYNKFNRNLQKHFKFPYHIKVNTDKHLSASIYNMNLNNEKYNLDFIYFNELSSDESLMLYLTTFRDSVTENILTPNVLPNYTPMRYSNTEGAIILQVIIKTSSNVINNLLNNPTRPLVKYRMTLQGDPNAYQAYGIDLQYDISRDIDIENNQITLRAYLTTNNAVDERGRLCIVDNALYPVPHVPIPLSYYFIEETVKVQIFCLQKSLDNTIITSPHDKILKRNSSYFSGSDLENDYYVSTVNEVLDVKLFRNYENFIYPLVDVNVIQPVYKKYLNDVYKRYTENIFQRDENGQIIMEEVEIEVNGEMTTVTKPVILHAKDELILDAQGQPQIDIPKGTTMVDPVTGLPLIDIPEKYECIIKNIPVYERIYCVNSAAFFKILESYEKLIDKIKSLSTIAPGEITFSLGIRNSTGPGEYEIFDQQINEWIDIDNISLTFDIGVKMKSGLSLNEDITSLIRTEINNYIKNFTQTDMTVFAIEQIINYVKQQIDDIEYILFYKINGFPASRVQSIRKKNYEIGVKDILCVKQTINTTESNIEGVNPTVVFRPAITVKEIT
jgi:hypothetical protein